MKIKKQGLINLFICYLAYIFFYGIIVKVTINNPVLFRIKTFVPDIILFIIAIKTVFISKFKMNEKTFILAFYLIVIVAVNYVIYGPVIQSFYWWRDLLVPFITCFFLSNVTFDESEIDFLLKKLNFLAKIFLVLGCILAIVEQIKGWKWTSSFYTGYVFYEIDPYSKIKIAHNMGILRAPSLTGNYSSFAFYSCFSAIVILANKDSNKLKKLFWSIVALINCALSTNKSALIVYSCIIVLMITESKRKTRKILNRIIITGIAIIVIAMVLNRYEGLNANAEFYTGFLNRIGIWNELFKSENIVNLIFPFKMFLYGSGGENELSFVDNIYIYILMAQGIWGFFLWARYIYYYYSKALLSRLKYMRFIKYNMYYFLLVGITSNVIQGRGYFSFFMIILVLFSKVRKTEINVL